MKGKVRRESEHDTNLKVGLVRLFHYTVVLRPGYVLLQP